jgi:uncharacterized metal-binding protein YceD (DUF177 family)
MSSVVAVHSTLWLNVTYSVSISCQRCLETVHTFRSGAVTSGRMDMNGRTSSKKRTTACQFLAPARYYSLTYNP